MNNEPLTMNRIYITESPRDAQQGLAYTIAPEARARYINQLMQAGYDVIDFGSFVSPKAVPQMAASGKVLSLIDKASSPTKLLAIVGNSRGAQEAAAEDKVDIIGFPYSVSDTFLKKNINSSIDVVFQNTLQLKKISDNHGKAFRVFISMALGNPYGDAWSETIVKEHAQKLADNGIRIITLSDTIGAGTPGTIRSLLEQLIPQYPEVEIGIHLHTKPDEAYAKLDAAWRAGCRHFDGVLNGLGGCPMTGYELLGNVNTLEILRYCRDKNISTELREDKISEIIKAYAGFDHLERVF